MLVNRADNSTFRDDWGELHGQSPQVLAAAIVKAGFNDIAYSGKICSAVGVNNTLGARCSARSKRNGNHVILVGGMRM